jgi:endogenous inhibitor of DNA gyrase (YacG/DUF329 family)
MTDAKATSSTSQRCPTCGAPTVIDVRPFCSKRCADIDLGRWFQGKYAIPAVDAADDTIIDAAVVSAAGIAHSDDDDR